MATPDYSFMDAHDELAILSGLTVAPEFHANGICLDWLLRLVLSKSRGNREPNFKEIERALNGGLAQAGILHMEDPIGVPKKHEERHAARSRLSCPARTLAGCFWHSPRNLS